MVWPLHCITQYYMSPVALVVYSPVAAVNITSAFLLFLINRAQETRVVEVKVEILGLCHIALFLIPVPFQVFYLTLLQACIQSQSAPDYLRSVCHLLGLGSVRDHTYGGLGVTVGLPIHFQISVNEHFCVCYQSVLALEFCIPCVLRDYNPCPFCLMSAPCSVLG